MLLAKTKRYQQGLQGDHVCVCVYVPCWQANKSTLILQDTLVTMLKSIQVLMCFYQVVFSLFSRLGELWSHPYEHNYTQTSHMHTNTPQPWSKSQMAVNRLLWAGLDESVSLDTGVFLPSGRLLVYFSTHQRLYVPSLSFCSDRDQIQAMDHVKSIWIIQNCRCAAWCKV